VTDVMLGLKVGILMQYLALLDKPVGLDTLRVVFPVEGWDELTQVIEQAHNDGLLIVDTVHSGKGNHVLLSVKNEGGE